MLSLYTRPCLGDNDVVDTQLLMTLVGVLALYSIWARWPGLRWRSNEKQPPRGAKPA